MGFKILTQLAMIAGLAIFGYGGYQKHIAEMNTSQAIRQANKQMGFYGAVIAGMDAKANQENADRVADRLMTIGGGTIFIGLALYGCALEFLYLKNAASEKEGSGKIVR